jgi:hypothetical protein
LHGPSRDPVQAQSGEWQPIGVNTIFDELKAENMRTDSENAILKDIVTMYWHV